MYEFVDSVTDTGKGSNALKNISKWRKWNNKENGGNLLLEKYRTETSLHGPILVLLIRPR
jgi:hypothetical protein